MKLWFLRIKHPKIDVSKVERAGLAPIVFADIPLASCKVGIQPDELSRIVDRIYKRLRPGAKQAHAATLRRFLTEAKVGDLVGIKVNSEPRLIFGRFAAGNVHWFPGM